MADFSWSEDRRAGVFLHISSLPSEYGIGNIGEAADSFFDFLEASGLEYWQICPLGPTGYGDSPYQSFSAFAGNIYFIDYTELCMARALDFCDLAPLKKLPRSSCDYGAIYSLIPNLVRKAYARYKKDGLVVETLHTFEDFCKKNADWLNAYALFTAIKKNFGGEPWYKWPEEFRSYSKAVKCRFDSETEEEIESVKFGQWIFFCQYERFKEKANSKNIRIFGDIPIFLAQDSADVWANSNLFELKKDGTPINVAGVGPDYFSAEGQLWGNPLYDWKGSKRAVYDFWRRRIEASCRMYDVIRFDHFRGFADYWSIPAELNDARKGVWKKGPGADFFNFLRKKFPTQKFVAEDLGLLSEAACDLRDSLNIPAMAVLQFAFGDTSANPYLPHNLKRNCVYYTGTHDNNTAWGWYNAADEKTKDRFRRYFRASGDSVNWDMIHAAMTSVAEIAIFPMQDVIGLGADCRMNTPGTSAGNWQWRMTSEQLGDSRKTHSEYLRGIAELSGRLPEALEIECKKIVL